MPGMPAPTGSAGNPLRGGHGACPVASTFNAKETGMAQTAWSKKRQRQYEHIKESAEEGGSSEKRAKEIAARTVNKTRAEHGETRSRRTR